MSFCQSYLQIGKAVAVISVLREYIKKREIFDKESLPVLILYINLAHFSDLSFSTFSSIDYASPFVQFQLAADLGTQRPDQCRVVYSRCAFSKADILSLMRQRGTSLDIKTDEEYQCTVLFLWNKKLNIPDKTQDEDEEYTDEEN